MFLKYKVDIPVVPGKLVRKNRGGHTYIEYEYDRIYDPVKQYKIDVFCNLQETSVLFLGELCDLYRFMSYLF